MSKKKVWVVEMLSTDGKWQPRSSFHLKKNDAVRSVSFDWTRYYPEDKFRVRKYVPARKEQS